jgi:hypothetical protein
MIIAPLVHQQKAILQITRRLCALAIPSRDGSALGVIRSRVTGTVKIGMFVLRCDVEPRRDRRAEVSSARRSGRDGRAESWERLCDRIASYHRWRSEHGSLKLDQMKCLKVLEKENVRLRKAPSSAL